MVTKNERGITLIALVVTIMEVKRYYIVNKKILFFGNLACFWGFYRI